MFNSFCVDRFEYLLFILFLLLFSIVPQKKSRGLTGSSLKDEAKALKPCAYFTPRSLGAAKASLIAGVIAKLMFEFLGGTGLVNHLAYNLAMSADW